MEGRVAVTQEARELRGATWAALVGFSIGWDHPPESTPWARQPSASKRECERPRSSQSPGSGLHLAQNFFKSQELSIDLKVQRKPLI